MRRPLAGLLLLASPAGFAADPPVNVVFRRATVLDGSGRPGFVADVHLNAGRVATVGPVGDAAGATEVDAAGLVICPGFIDLHTHCDSGLTGAGRANKNYVLQGCTTVVTGNCGSGPTDVAAFFRGLEAAGVGTNVIHLAPHNSIRAAVIGNVNRPPSPAEQAKMEAVVEQAMADGAWGLATGLIYNPGTYAKTEEIIGLAKAAAKRRGLYASHIRDEGAGLLPAIEEALRIGKESGCPVHVSHIKASGKAAHGKAADAVGLIEAARATGQTVTADQYPYTASSTSLRATVVPARYREGSQADFISRLEDPTVGPKLRADVAKAVADRDAGARIQIARYSNNPAWQGMTVKAVAELVKKEPAEVVLEIERNGGAQIVNFAMTEEDVRLYMQRPWVATASDGSVQTPGPAVPHPRSYGTFPRKVGRYAVADGVVTLEAAVRSGTGLPADILGLVDRGYLRPGAFADVLVFDPKTYVDTATYAKPHQYPTGVRWVFVNGMPVVADGKYRPGVLAGRVLRHE